MLITDIQQNPNIYYPMHHVCIIAIENKRQVINNELSKNQQKNNMFCFTWIIIVFSQAMFYDP